MPKIPSINNELDPERLRNITNSMIEAITSPAFVEAMRSLRSVSTEERLAEGARLLSPDNLRAQGVNLPEDIRISSRYFEAGDNEPIEFNNLVETRDKLLQSLEETQPGLLDKLKDTIPNVYDLLKNGEIPDLGRNSWGGCACGGGLSFCAGAGGGT